MNGLAVLAPAGVVGMRLGVLLRAGPLLLMGPWGRRRVLNLDLGFDPAEEMTAEGQAFVGFFKLVQQHYISRTRPIPTFTHEKLRTLTMPVMAIAGGKDAYFDADRMKRRLKECLPQIQINYLPEAGHGLVDCTLPILKFLRATKARR